jgi:midasin
VLTLLVRLAERVLSLRLDTPLMKVLAGVELLQKKCSEWELYASSDTTLKECMASIGSLIARWRKAELRSWHTILHARHREFELASVDLWFHAHRLLRFRPETLFESNNNSSGVADGEDYAPFFQAFRDFLVTARYGDFKLRLCMLRSLCGQISASEEEEAARELSQRSQQQQQQQQQQLEGSAGLAGVSVPRRMALLFSNLVAYYEQFAPDFDAEFARVATPVYTKVTDFVKVAKWDDQTYYAAAESAARAHRTLIRHTGEYERDVLSLPISGFLAKCESEFSLTAGLAADAKLKPGAGKDLAAAAKKGKKVGGKKKKGEDGSGADLFGLDRPSLLARARTWLAPVATANPRETEIAEIASATAAQGANPDAAAASNLLRMAPNATVKAAAMIKNTYDSPSINQSIYILEK